jgi:hypothetical protein
MLSMLCKFGNGKNKIKLDKDHKETIMGKFNP